MDRSPRALPPLPFPVAWALMKFIDWTNMPDEPQQGSYTRPLKGWIIATNSLTTACGV